MPRPSHSASSASSLSLLRRPAEPETSASRNGSAGRLCAMPPARSACGVSPPGRLSTDRPPGLPPNRVSSSLRPRGLPVCLPPPEAPPFFPGPPSCELLHLAPRRADSVRLWRELCFGRRHAPSGAVTGASALSTCEAAPYQTFEEGTQAAWRTKHDFAGASSPGRLDSAHLRHACESIASHSHSVCVCVCHRTVAEAITESLCRPRVSQSSLTRCASHAASASPPSCESWESQRPRALRDSHATRWLRSEQHSRSHCQVPKQQAAPGKRCVSRAWCSHVAPGCWPRVRGSWRRRRCC